MPFGKKQKLKGIHRLHTFTVQYLWAEQTKYEIYIKWPFGTESNHLNVVVVYLSLKVPTLFFSAAAVFAKSYLF